MAHPNPPPISPSLRSSANLLLESTSRCWTQPFNIPTTSLLTSLTNIHTYIHRGSDTHKEVQSCARGEQVARNNTLHLTRRLQPGCSNSVHPETLARKTEAPHVPLFFCCFKLSCFLCNKLTYLIFFFFCKFFFFFCFAKL